MVSGVAGAGFAGVRSYRDFAGARWSFVFFGFFASRPRLSRLPMTHSSSCWIRLDDPCDGRFVSGGCKTVAALAVMARSAITGAEQSSTLFPFTKVIDSSDEER